MMEQARTAMVGPCARAQAPSDEELVAAVARGRDPQAFRRLVDRHAALALRLAERVLLNRADAEEAVQEAFQKLWRHAGRFRPDRAGFRTWFLRVLINACRDRQRRAMRRPVAAGCEAAALADDDGGVERLDRIHAVRQAIAALPDRQRWAVVMAYYEGLSNREAAAAMGVSLKAFEAILVRARRRLATILA